MRQGSLSIVLLIFLLSLSFSLVVSQATDPSQVQALINLYTATQGPYWISQWNISTDPCLNNWFGIQCSVSSGVSYVYSISLPSNNLRGQISDLSAITTLQYFYLSFNLLTGTIPSTLAIPGLIQLGLDSNRLVGTIPSSFQNLNQLQTLYLHENQLTGEINFVAGLKSAVYVYLSSNQLSGTISNEIADLPLLQQLGVDNNKLVGTIPAGFGANEYYFSAFYGQNNLFSGILSPSLPLCTSNSTICDLSGNQFACPIPVPTCCQVTQCVYW